MKTTRAIIVTYKTRPPDLARCLESLVANNVLSTVIDNDVVRPGKVIQSVCQQYQARYSAQTKNNGFAQAAHQGATQASEPYLLFINPDAYLPRKNLLVAERILTNEKTVGAIGCALYAHNGSSESRSWGTLVTPLSLLLRRLMPSQPVRHNQSVGWVSGGGMLVRKQAYQEVGGFDPRFFLYWEDVDLCRRLRHNGWDIRRVTTPHIIHQRGASEPDNTIRTRIYDQSADKYFHKHYAKSTWLFQRLMRMCYRLFSVQVQ